MTGKVTKEMQNTSHAVMAQRHEAPDSLDDFPTPPWGTKALCEFLEAPDSQGWLKIFTCWEPTCNRGYMVRPLEEYFRSVHASDVHDYSEEGDGQDRVVDFLSPWDIPRHIEMCCGLVGGVALFKQGHPCLFTEMIGRLQDMTLETALFWMGVAVLIIVVILGMK